MITISSAPDALNNPIATIKATSEGNILKVDLAPCLAPAINSVKISDFLKIAYIIIRKRNKGKIRLEK